MKINKELFPMFFFGPDEQDKKIAELEQRIEELEEQLKFPPMEYRRLEEEE